MSQFLLKNGTIVNADQMFQKDILIVDEKIAKVEDSISVDTAIVRLDCSNKLIFPGIIDTHTHMRVPIKSGYSVDDFYSGTKSAIHGGVTTILDFTILKNNQSLLQSIESRMIEAKKSLCDFGLHCNITHFSEEILDEIPFVIASGITSFKVFTTYKEAGMMLTYDEIYKVAQIISDNDGILMVHAEDDDILKSAMKQYADKSITDPIYHGYSRPNDAEAKAIERLSEISEQTNCKIYIVHISSAKGLEVAKGFKNLIIETCPQYLFLDENAYNRSDGRMYVASPPLRKQKDNKTLWEGILQNHISTIGTDHCPFMLSDKYNDILFTKIPNGMGGVETLFPVLLAEWIKRDLDLSLLSQLLCKNPADIFGLSDRKGLIDEGFDADLVVVNPKNIETDWFDNLVSITDWNAYLDYPAIFPENVFRRGDWIVKDKIVQNLSNGSFLKNRLF